MERVQGLGMGEMGVVGSALMRIHLGMEVGVGMGEGGVIGGVRGGERVSENLISGMDGLITYQHPITCSSVVTHVKSFSHSPI